jgi:hypothetical protein
MEIYIILMEIIYKNKTFRLTGSFYCNSDQFLNESLLSFAHFNKFNVINERFNTYHYVFNRILKIHPFCGILKIAYCIFTSTVSRFKLKFIVLRLILKGFSLPNRWAGL